jgi:hypothetical protein
VMRVRKCTFHAASSLKNWMITYPTCPLLVEC